MLPSGFLSLIVHAAIDGTPMARMFCWIAAALPILATALAARTPAIAGDPSGTWLSRDGTAKVHIVGCGEAICGTVVWLSQPYDAETGKSQADKLNTDPQLRGRPIIGVRVVLDMQRLAEDNKWLGRVYNPEDGNTYNGSIEVIDSTRLKVEGCVAIHCQAEIWTRSN